MKKVLLLTLLALGLVVPSVAQPPTYDDLLIYYADGDYEKLLKKAGQIHDRSCIVQQYAKPQAGRGQATLLNRGLQKRRL